MSQKKEINISIEDFQKLQDRLEKMEKESAARNDASSFSTPSSSSSRPQKYYTQPASSRRRKSAPTRFEQYEPSNVPDDPNYKDMSNDPTFIEITQTKFEFARNFNGEKNSRLLVQQTPDPNKICEYGRIKNQNTCYCLGCKNRGHFLFFAPTAHESKCFISKGEADFRQKCILQKTSSNPYRQQQKYETDDEEDDVQQDHGNQDGASESGPDIKRMRLDNPKTFASVECQTDEHYMCNLSNRPTQIEDTPTEFRCIVDVHGYGKGEIDARRVGDMLVVTAEHADNREGILDEKRTILCHIKLPKYTGKNLSASVNDRGLLVVTFPKIVEEEECITITF